MRQNIYRTHRLIILADKCNKRVFCAFRISFNGDGRGFFRLFVNVKRYFRDNIVDFVRRTLYCNAFVFDNRIVRRRNWMHGFKSLRLFRTDRSHFRQRKRTSGVPVPNRNCRNSLVIAQRNVNFHFFSGKNAVRRNYLLTSIFHDCQNHVFITNFLKSRRMHRSVLNKRRIHRRIINRNISEVCASRIGQHGRGLLLRTRFRNIVSFLMHYRKTNVQIVRILNFIRQFDCKAASRRYTCTSVGRSYVLQRNFRHTGLFFCIQMCVFRKLRFRQSKLHAFQLCFLYHAGVQGECKSVSFKRKTIFCSGFKRFD